MKQFIVFGRQGRASPLAGIKYSGLSILIFITFTLFLIRHSVVHAQNADYVSYCQSIAADHAPQDDPDPQYREPVWDELDKNHDRNGVHSLKTTVTDTFQMIDVPGPAGRGGVLTSQSLTLPNAKEVADYLEGRFLDEDHRLADLRTFKSSDNLYYNGSVVRLTPQKVLDRLRLEYIYALSIYGKRDPLDPNSTYKTPDILLTYADVCGQNPRTILDLLHAYEFPAPPSLINNPTEADYNRWDHGWRKYWAKIPLHAPSGTISCSSFSLNPDDPAAASCQGKFPEGVYDQPPNMLSQGCLVFRRLAELGSPPTEDCPQQSAPPNPNLLTVRLGVPDLLRLDTLARFTQQLLVPQKMLRLYYCKFRDAFQRPDEFCENGNRPAMSGATAPAQGEQGTGGSPIKIYDPQIPLLGGSETVETIKIETKLPYLGLTFGKLTSAITGGATGAFNFFDPANMYLKDDKYQQNSTRLPYSFSFTDTTIPVAGGHITEPKIWAGFLSGIKKSKNFVICSLLPSKQDAAACAVQAGL